MFQSKGQLFNKMLEQKRSLNDPQKIETDISRALDLAFDNKDLAVLSTLKEAESIEPVYGGGGGITSVKREKEFKLKLNSKHQISLE